MWIIILIVLLQGYPIDVMKYKAGGPRIWTFASQWGCQEAIKVLEPNVWQDLKMEPEPDVTFSLRCVEVTP